MCVCVYSDRILFYVYVFYKLYIFFYKSCVQGKKERSSKPTPLSHISQTGKIKDLKGRKEKGIYVH